MDDELEDKVLYQTFVSQMKLLSKLAVVNSPPLTYCWKIIRLSLRPEVIFCTVILVILLLYLRAVDLWSRGVREWLQTTLGRHKKMKLLEVAGDLQSWDAQSTQSSAFAILGRRPKMEDRWVAFFNLYFLTMIWFERRFFFIDFFRRLGGSAAITMRSVGFEPGYLVWKTKCFERHSMCLSVRC